jgi:prepilin-type N-terminal cleavage/methylation domain-containing protein
MIEFNLKHKAFSLIEVLVALIVASMALIAVFTIYDRARRASDSITQKIDQYVMPSEIMQKIAEDLDRVAAPGSNAKITITNSFQNGLAAAKLTITSQIIDKDKNEKTLEKVVWQTDFDMATGRLILYRSHSGLIWEDNLLDKAQRADWSPDRELFVPLCTGISYFKIDVPQPQDLSEKASVLQANLSTGRFEDYSQTEEQKFFETWNQAQLPPAVRVTLSFAAPIEGRTAGGVEVPDDQKLIRTVVIDRSKKMNFKYISPIDANDLTQDANSLKTGNAKQGSSVNSDEQAGSEQQPGYDRPFSRNRTRSRAQPIHDQ